MGGNGGGAGFGIVFMLGIVVAGVVLAYAYVAVIAVVAAPFLIYAAHKSYREKEALEDERRRRSEERWAEFKRRQDEDPYITVRTVQGFEGMEYSRYLDMMERFPSWHVRICRAPDWVVEREVARGVEYTPISYSRLPGDSDRDDSSR